MCPGPSESFEAGVLNAAPVLSLEERVHLLQSWILPLLVFPARVIFPSEQVITPPPPVRKQRLVQAPCGGATIISVPRFSSIFFNKLRAMKGIWVEHE